MAAGGIGARIPHTCCSLHRFQACVLHSTACGRGNTGCIWAWLVTGRASYDVHMHMHMHLAAIAASSASSAACKLRRGHGHQCLCGMASTDVWTHVFSVSIYPTTSCVVCCTFWGSF
jgi:hypothetical protein